MSISENVISAAVFNRAVDNVYLGLKELSYQDAEDAVKIVIETIEKENVDYV